MAHVGLDGQPLPRAGPADHQEDLAVHGDGGGFDACLQFRRLGQFLAYDFFIKSTKKYGARI